MFTQVSLVLLLWGTMCGGLCLISDVGHMLLQRLGEGALPGWVNGRSCMAAVALLVLFTHRANVQRLRAGTESRFERVRFWRRRA